jgi:sulfonate transport system ATP-binding protein
MSLIESLQYRAGPALPVAPAFGFRVSDVTKRFGDRTILEDFNLEVQPGEFTVLLGKSGSGKTTLLRILADLDTVDEGSVVVPRNRSVVFQEPRLIPSNRVWRNVLLGLPRGEGTRERAAQALGEVGLSGHGESWPHTLSGGEAQRAALARALVRQPKLLLLDEPFAALDALTRLRMQDLVADLWRAHRPAVLLVTHDVDEAILLADRIVVLIDGKIGLDERVDQERPRSRAVPQFDRLRRKLLASLGVTSH